MKTPHEIEQRLAEIENERAELAAIDFDAEMRQATIEDGDLDATSNARRMPSARNRPARQRRRHARQ